METLFATHREDQMVLLQMSNTTVRACRWLCTSSVEKLRHRSLCRAKRGQCRRCSVLGHPKGKPPAQSSPHSFLVDSVAFGE